MPDLGSLVDALGTLLKPLFRAFVRTAAGMLVLSLLLAIVVYRIASTGGTPWKAAVAVLLVLLCGAILGSMLAVKRAVLTALREGAKAQRLGQRTLDALFSRLLGVKDGQRSAGSGLGAAVEKIPLARAEQLARDAANKLIDEGRSTGFFRARLHRMAIERIESLTLTRFRAEDSAAGGIDLVKIRDELAATVEEKLISVINGMMFKFTLILCLVYIAGSIAVAEILQRV
jgi:hypothetical protein